MGLLTDDVGSDAVRDEELQAGLEGMAGRIMATVEAAGREFSAKALAAGMAFSGVPSPPGTGFEGELSVWRCRSFDVSLEEVTGSWAQGVLGRDIGGKGPYRACLGVLEDGTVVLTGDSGYPWRSGYESDRYLTAGVLTVAPRESYRHCASEQGSQGADRLEHAATDRFLAAFNERLRRG